MTVDLTLCPQAAIGSKVELWGRNLLVDVVAAAAGTIGYELLTALAARVPVCIGEWLVVQIICDYWRWSNKSSCVSFERVSKVEQNTLWNMHNCLFALWCRVFFARLPGMRTFIFIVCMVGYLLVLGYLGVFVADKICENARSFSKVCRMVDISESYNHKWSVIFTFLTYFLMPPIWTTYIFEWPNLNPFNLVKRLQFNPFFAECHTIRPFSNLLIHWLIVNLVLRTVILLLYPLYQACKSHIEWYATNDLLSESITTHFTGRWGEMAKIEKTTTLQVDSVARSGQ